MNETTKIRENAIKYCNGCGIDVGCGDEKICQSAIGIDSSIGNNEFRDLSCVNIKRRIDNLEIFSSNSLDYVYSSHFLEHFIFPEKMLLEMCRVVRSGGYVIIYLPDKDLYTESNPDHHHMWNLESFKQIVPECMDVVEEIAKHDYSFFIVLRKK